MRRRGTTAIVLRTYLGSQLILLLSLGQDSDEILLTRAMCSLFSAVNTIIAVGASLARRVNKSRDSRHAPTLWVGFWEPIRPRF